MSCSRSRDTAWTEQLWTSANERRLPGSPVMAYLAGQLVFLAVVAALIAGVVWAVVVMRKPRPPVADDDDDDDDW